MVTKEHVATEEEQKAYFNETKLWTTPKHQETI